MPKRIVEWFNKKNDKFPRLVGSLLGISGIVEVSSGLQIAGEWGNEDAGIIVLDIITLSVTAAQTVVEVADLVLLMTSFELVAIPIAGAVLAIVGFILAAIAQVTPPVLPNVMAQLTTEQGNPRVQPETSPGRPRRNTSWRRRPSLPRTSPEPHCPR